MRKSSSGEALRKKERQDETQFTTKIAIYTETDPLIAGLYR
jgi:hypothetical protein